MGAASNFELISRAVTMALHYAEEVQTDIHEQLETSASTVLVNGLRTLTMHSTVIAVGSFSVFEALLQRVRGWAAPFQELDKELRAEGHVDLADRFIDYRNAINALKHGEGRSYDALLKRRHAIQFKIADPNEPFFDEGDVSEIPRLVDADHEFVRQCSEIIEEVMMTLSKP